MVGFGISLFAIDVTYSLCAIEQTENLLRTESVLYVSLIS